MRSFIHTPLITLKSINSQNTDNNNENNEVPVGNIDGCADQYPWNFVETFDDYQASQGNQGGNKNSNIPNNIKKGIIISHLASLNACMALFKLNLCRDIE